MRTQFLLWGAIAGLVAGTSCTSSGPEPPKPGTPAFYWNAAKTTYHSGDFVKTSENLQQILQSDNEFTARARPWAILMSAGLARGYMDAADAYESGAKMNRANPTPFRKDMSSLRTLANAAAMEFTEGVHKLLTDNSPEVLLAFENPTGSAIEPPGLRKITSGQLVQDSERDGLVRAMIQRGMILAAAAATGSPNDSAKLADVLKTGEAKAPRTQFLAAMAQELYDRSALYSPTKLDLPNRTTMLCQTALDALKVVPETKDTKTLTGKIEASLKKLKGTT